jgi:hypothetical protein
MLPKIHYKNFLIIFLLISSVFITIAGIRSVNKVDIKIEKISSFDSITKTGIVT